MTSFNITIPIDYPSSSVKTLNADGSIRKEALKLARETLDSLSKGIQDRGKENKPTAQLIIDRSVVPTTVESLAKHLLIVQFIEKKIDFFVHLPKESNEFSGYLKSQGYNVVVVKQ